MSVGELLEIVIPLVCLFFCVLLVKKRKRIKKPFLKSFTYYLIYALSVMSFCGLLVETGVLPRIIITENSSKNESSSNDVRVEHSDDNDKHDGTETITENDTEEVPVIINAEEVKMAWDEWCKAIAPQIYYSYDSLLTPHTGYSYSEHTLWEIGRGLENIYEDTGIPYSFRKNDPDNEGWAIPTTDVSTYFSSDGTETLSFKTGIEKGIYLWYEIADNYVDNGCYRWIHVEVDTNDGSPVPRAWEHIAKGMHPEGLLLSNTTPMDLYISDNMRLWILEEHAYSFRDDETDFLIAEEFTDGSSYFRIEYRLSGSGEGFAQIESFVLTFEQDSDNILRLKDIRYFIPHS